MFRIEEDYHVYGIKRNGNHAIINWITSMMKPNVMFMNDVKNIPFVKQTHYDRFESRDIWKYMVFSYEDKSIKECDPNISIGLKTYGPHGYINKDEIIGKSSKTTRIVLLRDFFNFYASLYRYNKDKVPHHSIRLWKEYAYEFLRETKFTPDDTIFISYNKWTSDEMYRRSLALSLGLVYSENTLDVVSSYGHGSSFDNTNYDGRGREMKIFDRWKLFINDDVFKSHIDAECILLSNKIFGKLQGEEILYNG